MVLFYNSMADDYWDFSGLGSWRCFVLVGISRPRRQRLRWSYQIQSSCHLPVGRSRNFFPLYLLFVLLNKSCLEVDQSSLKIRLFDSDCGFSTNNLDCNFGHNSTSMVIWVFVYLFSWRFGISAGKAFWENPLEWRDQVVRGCYDNWRFVVDFFQFG